jgi:hypothetical protein
MITADKRRISGAIVPVNYWFYRGLRFAFRILLAQFPRNSGAIALANYTFPKELWIDPVCV